MLDVRGFVAETNATHVFIVRHGRVSTSRTVACPEGITRRTVLELCAAHGIAHEVRDVSQSEVYAADECFCTGTMGELAGVVRVDGRAIAKPSAAAATPSSDTGAPNPAHALLRFDAFRRAIRERGVYFLCDMRWRRCNNRVPIGGKMAANVKCVDYFYVTVPDQPGQAYRLLAELASAEVNLLAFGAIPVGPTDTQLTLFPESSGRMANSIERLGLMIHGPHSALLVQGDDQLGALVDIHRRLSDARINIYASNGVTNGAGGYGYVIYIRPEDFNRAVDLLDARWTR
jgi:hypothetical protein